MNMAGQTINDRLLAARHSLAGQGLAKSVCKATTEEMIGPKKKHLDCKWFGLVSSETWCIVFLYNDLSLRSFDDDDFGALLTHSRAHIGGNPRITARHQHTQRPMHMYTR